MNLLEFQKNLGHAFNQERLLIESLTHPSYSRSCKSKERDNQRLEFLGDAVLQLAVTEKLFALFPLAAEGALTKLRARLVSRDQMAVMARRLQVGEVLILGAGEERNSGRDRESNLADAMESILGAVFLDAGWETAKEIVLKLMDPRLSSLDPHEEEGASNAKGALQELLQTDGNQPPLYRCIQEIGEAHSRSYAVVVLWQGKELGRGEGPSKRAAETEAARHALANLSKRAGTTVEITKVGSSDA